EKTVDLGGDRGYGCVPVPLARLRCSSEVVLRAGRADGEKDLDLKILPRGWGWGRDDSGTLLFLWGLYHGAGSTSYCPGHGYCTCGGLFYPYCDPWGVCPNVDPG